MQIAWTTSWTDRAERAIISHKISLRNHNFITLSVIIHYSMRISSQPRPSCILYYKILFFLMIIWKCVYISLTWLYLFGCTNQAMSLKPTMNSFLNSDFTSCRITTSIDFELLKALSIRYWLRRPYVFCLVRMWMCPLHCFV